MCYAVFDIPSLYQPYPILTADRLASDQRIGLLAS